MGAPQGSILGPLLFSQYINYLTSEWDDVVVQMYLDNSQLRAWEGLRTSGSQVISGEGYICKMTE